MNRLSYRPDIDGLRAVAVLGVLFFHAGLDCQGGFVGVDVFFVISGFLITSLILRDLREGTFSFVDFWARRIRRIVPALAVMTLAVIVVGYFGMFPDYYEALGKQVIALVLCVSNVKFWRETGYFDTASDEKPLLHTWSLSVEEQFYFIIPIALFLIFRFKREKLALPLIVLTCVVSFAAAVYASIHYPSANFYLLPTRAWELGVGSLLAFAGPIKNPKLREFSSFIGLTLIIGCYFLFPEGVSFPGASALPPVLGAALLIWSGIGQEHLPNINRFLTLKPIVGIGLISYSLYLWHWPIFAYQKLLGYSADSDAVQFSLLLISFLPAWLSWKFVETPFRVKRVFQTQRNIIKFGASIALCGITLGLLLFGTEGAIFREEMKAIKRIEDICFNTSFRRADDLDLKDENITTGKLGRLHTEGKSIDFVLWGDSHSISLANSFHKAAIKTNKRGILFSTHSRLPLIDLKAKGYSDLSRTSIKRIIEFKPQRVFLTGYWYRCLTGRSEHQKNSLVLNEIQTNKNMDSILVFQESIHKTLKFFNDNNIYVSIISDVPDQKQQVGRIFLNFKAQNYLPFRKKTLTLPGISMREHLNDQALVNSLFAEITKNYEKAEFINTTPLFFESGKCAIGDLNASYYRDNDHLNDYGAETLLGKSIESWMKNVPK